MSISIQLMNMSTPFMDMSTQLMDILTQLMNISTQLMDMSTPFIDMSGQFIYMLTQFMNMSTRLTDMSTPFIDMSTQLMIMSTELMDMINQLIKMSTQFMNMSKPFVDSVPGPPPKFRPDLPYNQRWEPLKPYLERLYLEEKMKLPEIVTMMKRQYGFDASEAQYKHKFKSWKWKKNISAAKKAQICRVVQTRAVLGESMIVKYKGKEIDGKKLISFLRWNIPYKTITDWQSRALPDGLISSTNFREMSPMSDIEITPSSDITSFCGAPTALSQALSMRPKPAIQRAQLFVQGRVEDLMLSMNRSEQRTTVQWLKQYWIFSFRTAKQWGWGPRDWTSNNLRFHNSRQTTPQRLLENSHAPVSQQLTPSQLCRWSVHLSDEDWDELSFVSSGSETPDPEDESTWRIWPEYWETPPFEQKLAEALQTNAFSTLEKDQLPLSMSHVAKAAENSKELLLEALGFSIISRNVGLLVELIKKANDVHAEVSSLYPYHLATSYLDGAETCCNLLHDLADNLEVNLRQNYTNALGHTVLDNLMIAILKSHTRTSPGFVDQKLAKEPSFKGEEVDICGRWDADSECYRALLANGKSAVPPSWKHKFCGTSAQTICHCLSFLKVNAADLNLQSGLFLRYCSNCGLTLQLGPLHTLVLVAFQLAQAGFEGEDLFGALACLLHLLTLGTNPLLSANISLSALLGQENMGTCNHEELRPFDLAQQVPPEVVSQWFPSARTGWLVFCFVLRSAQDAWELNFEDEEDNNEKVDMLFGCTCLHHWQFNVESHIGDTIQLGHIWVAVQAEFLSYRRLTESDAWLSEHFSMERLLTSIETGGEVFIGYVEQDMLLPYCRCGYFSWSPTLQAVLTEGDISNMKNDDVRCTLMWP
ncbi:hypothetical protein EG329_009855 [Mollisiaceae sp. DMI_Dod_QoI]|nr:hypothetical protein EG329_009855 [Helotiales sp. DMI_Dod_QoI]